MAAPQEGRLDRAHREQCRGLSGSDPGPVRREERIVAAREGAPIPGREQRGCEQAVELAVMRRLEVLASRQEDDAGGGFHHLRCGDRRLPRGVLVGVRAQDRPHPRARCAPTGGGGAAVAQGTGRRTRAVVGSSDRPGLPSR
jgi:hypothetical protein